MIGAMRRVVVDDLALVNARRDTAPCRGWRASTGVLRRRSRRRRSRRLLLPRRSLRGGRHRRVAPAGLLGRLHARLERRHQIDHLRRLGGDGSGSSNSSPAALRSIRSSTCSRYSSRYFDGFEVGRQRCDQRLGHLHFLGADVDVVEHVELVDRRRIGRPRRRTTMRDSSATCRPGRGSRRRTACCASRSDRCATLPALFHRPRQQHVRLRRSCRERRCTACRSTPGRSRRDRRTPRGRCSWWPTG